MPHRYISKSCIDLPFPAETFATWIKIQGSVPDPTKQNCFKAWSRILDRILKAQDCKIHLTLLNYRWADWDTVPYGYTVLCEYCSIAILQRERKKPRNYDIHSFISNKKIEHHQRVSNRQELCHCVFPHFDFRYSTTSLSQNVTRNISI